MTKAERELLVEEKNQILGNKKDSESKIISEKRKLFFQSDSKMKDYEPNNTNTKNSNITDDDRALLKVTIASKNDNL